MKLFCIFVNGKKCFVMKQLYVVLISLFIGLEVGAQTTIATTHIVNNGQNGITFNVKNNNAATVRLFAINSAHSLDQPTVASTVTVWFKISSSTALPGAITAANGWTNAGSFALNRTYLATTPFISNLAIDIPADSTCRVFVGTTQTLGYETLTLGAGVNTFSGSGVDLMTGDSIGFGGPATGPTNTPRGFVGSVVVYPLGSCAGTPESGSINVVGNAGTCPNENRLFYLSGYIPSVNISYQWQVASSPTGTYSNIGTNSTLLARNAGTTNAYFRCIATCSNSGLKDTTSVFADTIKPFYHCYCASNSTNLTYTKIDSTYFLTTKTGTPTTTCESYTDYRYIPIPIVRVGEDLKVTIKDESCTSIGALADFGAIYVDLNRNGVFDVAERLGTVMNMSQGVKDSRTITIPLSNPLGITGLRTMIYNGTAPASSCHIGSFGETEDYLINIIKDSIDAKLLSVINLENGCSLGNTNISFSVTNIGINAINPLTVSYSVNGGTPVTENLSTLAVGATSNYTFATPANLSGQGTKVIKIWHNNPLDTNKTNDTVFKTIINFPTPPTPVADDDTVCLGAPQTILRAPSYDSFMTRWYTDAAATNEIAQGDQMVINNPTASLTRYAKSVYVTSTNFGPPATVTPEVNVVGTGVGLIFDVLRNKVRINSVNMKFGTSGIGAIEIRNSANTLLSTSSFIVTTANVVMTIPINFELPIGTGYRMILSTNPGISIGSGSFTAFPQQVPSVISITGSTVTNQYNMFYDWNITYDACVSPTVPVNSVYISTTNSPMKVLFKDTFFCQYPDAYLNAQNSGATYKWQDNSTNQSIKVTGTNLYIVTITNSVGCNVVD